MENRKLRCDNPLCHQEIPEGAAHVSIVRNIEQRERISEELGQIQIIDSRDLITLCGKCGNAFDYELLEKIIRELPLLDPNGFTLRRTGFTSI